MNQPLPAARGRPGTRRSNAGGAASREARRSRLPALLPHAGRPAVRQGRDRGAASMFVLAIGLVLVMAGATGAAVGAARVGRHQARLAADAGALAGAVRAVEGRPPACERAAELVAANRGRLVGCEVRGLEIVVRAEVTVTPLPGLLRRVTVTARAGPIRAFSAKPGYVEEDVRLSKEL